MIRVSNQWWGTGLPPDMSLMPSLYDHQHVTNSVCAAFIALRCIPEFIVDHHQGEDDASSPPEPGTIFYTAAREGVVSKDMQLTEWGKVCQGLFLLQIMSGLGHPDCLTCHQRWSESIALGYHEAREILRSSYEYPQDKILFRKGLT